MSRSPVVLVTGALIGIGDVGGGDSRVRADGQPDQHAGEQQHRGVRVIAACMATAPSTPAGHTVLCRRLSAAEVGGTASADAIELVLTDRISHACKELK
jgi:hypothetical protein